MPEKFIYLLIINIYELKLQRLKNNMRNTDIMYHGSHNCFTEFDLKHVLEGSGEVKFGYGVYVTSKYSSAAHYSGQKTQSESENFVYTVAVPSLVDDNYIMFKQPVNAKIVMRTENVLGEKIPDKVKADGKLFRKYLANTLTGNDDLMGEKAAAEFFADKVTTKKWNAEECSNRFDLQRFHLSCRLFPTPP